MFLGRVETLDDYMKGYAVGPGGSAVVKKEGVPKTNLTPEQILEQYRKGVK
jgi:hypothetical protein